MRYRLLRMTIQYAQRSNGLIAHAQGQRKRRVPREAALQSDILKRLPPKPNVLHGADRLITRGPL